MDETEARRRLERMVAHDSAPTLAAAEVDDLVAAAKRPDQAGNLPTNVDGAAAWSPSTSYVPGQVVKTTAGGRWWICAVGGTTDATEPSWPDLDGYPRTGRSVCDGTVTWLDAGAEWAPTWDLNYAAAEGWLLKAGKAAGLYQFATDGQTFHRQQVIDHCERMEKHHRRRSWPGSMPVVGADATVHDRYIEDFLLQC